jgi:hypothetical protein
MAVLINEWLPNPVGDDALGEWIEIFNSGGQPQLLAGFRLENGAGKKYIFKTTVIGPQEYLLLPRSFTKLTLRNKDESLAFYDANGALISRSQFIGSAPEGKSFGRAVEDKYVFIAPTPGAKNVFPEVPVAKMDLPYGVPLNPSGAGVNVILAALFMGIGLSLVITTIIVKNEALKNLFLE